MNHKPLFAEQFLDDEDLYKLLKDIMTNIENLPSKLEFFINFKKQKSRAKIGKPIRQIISLMVKETSVVNRLLQRFEESRFLSSDIIQEYRQRLQKVQDKVKEITIRENLKWIT